MRPIDRAGNLRWTSDLGKKKLNVFTTRGRFLVPSVRPPYLQQEFPFTGVFDEASDQTRGAADNEGAVVCLFGVWTQKERSQDVIAKQRIAAVTENCTRLFKIGHFRASGDGLQGVALTLRCQPSTTRPERGLPPFLPSLELGISEVATRRAPFLFHKSHQNGTQDVGRRLPDDPPKVK